MIQRRDFGRSTCSLVSRKEEEKKKEKVRVRLTFFKPKLSEREFVEPHFFVERPRAHG